MRCFFRFILKTFFFFSFLGLLFAAGTLGWVYYLVTEVSCPEMTLENISSILGRESPVYYRNGKEKIGVLFEDIHRQYVKYDQLPEKFVNAIIAAEDDQFFNHYGIDFYGIARAMVANLKAGRIVQGGSTITQQTAKNLFKRKSRSYEAKLKEMLYALRLEYRFSKEQILEFYSNQFYVSGNGHGLGVAARYYFNKEPNQLTLLEAAFIAGSVKQPNYYNPFIKTDNASTLKAKLRAENRAQYVLGNMLKLGMISQKEYDQALAQEIMFNRGKTRFAVNTLMDLIKEGLESKVITHALKKHGINNISTSGARIISTVDQTLQAETLYSLRRHLSRLDVRLRGYTRREVQQEYKDKKGDREIIKNAFLFGTIKTIDKRVNKDPKKRVISVSFGPKHPEGFIDRQGLQRILVALVKYRKQRWSTPKGQDLRDLLSRLKQGDKIYVSVREVDSSDGTPILELERYPKLQGAALVLQQGMIRSMAGGMENLFFNRAVTAKRLMGSTFKPFLFTAALQLGWTPLDELDNKRNVFPFLGQAYFPRPDHKSPFHYVSMSWAGVKSENVAAVWLLYHLTDRLSPAQIQELAKFLDMAPRVRRGRKESYQKFSSRIRDIFGIRITDGILDQAAYKQAIRKLEADFVFDGRFEEYRRWQRIYHGLDFSKFREQLHEKLNRKGLTSRQRSEYWKRFSMLHENFLQFQNTYHALQRYRRYIEQLPSWFGNPFAFYNQQKPEGLDETRPSGTFAQDERGQLIYTTSNNLSPNWRKIDEFALRQRLARLFGSNKDALWNNVLLEGKVSSAGLKMIESQMRIELNTLKIQKKYSMQVLSAIPDYRIMLGIQYLVRLARECGIHSQLDPVLSFPLGSNVVSLLESVRMYETLITGKNYLVDLPPDEADDEVDKEKNSAQEQDGLAIIEQIIGADGEIIYTRETAATPVVDSKTSNEVTNILYNVVRYGTGRYALKNVRLKSTDKERDAKLQQFDLSLPLLGKTGTANDFRNAAFFGYVPTKTEQEGTLRLKGGYAVGVYAGFDNNDPMKKGSTHISGAQGALPTWSNIAQALYSLEGVAERLDPVDLAFNGISLKYPDTGQYFIPVQHKNGGVQFGTRAGKRTVITPSSPSALEHGTVGSDNSFTAERRFIPFWRNQRP
ncbi:MAG: glycosyl transferase family 51 [Candidatus Electrothrix sp. AU1_5]|nr:glycosyl transferase family 51 [Candidatus Electrothrix gigas]